MDFMNRGLRNGQTVDQQTGQPTSTSGNGGSAAKKSNKFKPSFGDSKLGKAARIGFLALVLLLVAAVVIAATSFNTGRNEAKLVDSSKYQAVFLNGGQVYFGKVAKLNDKFLEVNSVYYLRVNQQVQPDANASTSANDISLVKLGCELHGPTDQMVINSEQVVFWENLKADGQVAKAIEQYKQQYPDGQKCDQQSQQNSSTNNSSSSSNNENSTTTPSTTSTPPATPSTTNNTRR